MVPPAPTAFSTVTGCPSERPIGIAIMRATTSVGPPAANGTTSEIGRSGHVAWAAAAKERAISAGATSILWKVRMEGTPWVLGWEPVHLSPQVRRRASALTSTSERASGLTPGEQRTDPRRLCDGPQPVDEAAHFGFAGGAAVLREPQRLVGDLGARERVARVALGLVDAPLQHTAVGG